MTDQGDIEQQLKLLTIHRRTLEHSLRQHKALGVLAPAGLINGIHECWTNIAQIKAALRASGMDIADESDDERRELTISISTLSPIEWRNRSRMLQKVHDFWIKGVLENSLNGAALIELGMEYKLDAVVHPWDMVIQQPDQITHSIPHGTKIIDVFDKLGGEMLILGAPGSGKTTMLLELARDLIVRAERDETYPMPVVFNLSSWAEQRKPLVEWLIDELNTKYDVPKKIGKAWVDADQVLPLLDGLDEVNQEYPEACVEAINTFRQNHGLVNIVVCSRLADYTALTTRLRLQSAVGIHPLTTEQIDAYLTGLGDQLRTLRAALSEDVALRELAETPLILSVMTLAYQNVLMDELVARDPIGNRRTHVFAAYVDLMLRRRVVNKYWTKQPAIQWLSWLASTMSQQSQTIFFIDRKQPNCLSLRERRQYAMGVGLFVGSTVGVIVALIFALVLLPFSYGIENFVLVFRLVGPLYVVAGTVAGLICGLVVELSGGRRAMQITPTQGRRSSPQSSMISISYSGLIFGLVFGMISGLRTGLVIGLINGLIGGLIYMRVAKPEKITLVERLKWSWEKAKRGCARRVLISLFIGVLAGGWAYFRKGIPLDKGEVLFRTLAFLGSAVGIIWVLIRGLTIDEIEMRTSPTQGLMMTGRNAIIVTFAVGLITGSLYMVGTGLSIEGALVGLGLGILAGMLSGGLDIMRAGVLDFVLAWNGHIPMQLEFGKRGLFLDYCAERIFLRKVGGGYIFIHRMLMEYFASLDTTSR